MIHSTDHAQLQYGQSGLSLDIRSLNTTIIESRYTPALENHAAAFTQAVRNPYGSPPLRDIFHAEDTVAVVIADITRPLPSHLLLPWVLEELAHIPRENFRIIVGTGTHRANTREELCHMVGEDIMRTIPIINHDARDPSTLTQVGRSPFGYDVHLNTEYVEADRRLVLGFIEPHTMAGFSGGYKGVFPGIADLNAILHYHGYENIAHPGSMCGKLDGNPTQAHVRAAGSLIPVDFLINVTLNFDKKITAFFCGEVMEAHEAGCAYSKNAAMIPVDQTFPIVVTTNSGFPLDLNLYQSIKGMCTAATITATGGLIITAARCNNGFPSHGILKEQLFGFSSPHTGLAALRTAACAKPDQWQTQKLFQVLKHCRIQLFSELDPEDVRQAHLQPITDVRTAIDAELTRLGDPHAPIAILPEGPMTIPYLLEST